MNSGIARPLAGLATVIAIAAIVAVSVGLFRDSFTKTVPVTVISDRAGLVMNPEAKVKLNGAQVGKVASIDSLPDGTAALHLAIDPSMVDVIPANVGADITSSTVFGSKFVELVPPADPSAQPLRADQVIKGNHVTVEINTVFQQLVSVLNKLDPAKLNETLGAIAKAFNGRGEKIGQTLTDFDKLLAKLDPSLPNLKHDIEVLPAVANTYADASDDLIRTVNNTSSISRSIVDEQQNLDALLVSATGLADLGNEVVGDNRQGLADAVHVLLPSTSLLAKYHENVACGLAGIIPFATSPPLPVPGVLVSVSFLLGIERYRFPQDLPRVNAKLDHPICKEMGLPNVPYEYVPPMLVADVGANPWRYGNQGILLNSDGLKQFLFGPIDGPPRNSPQIGMPG
jgi:phospholipid/cholesterol/gamma-HCH transport system substrate-binding protein